MPQKMIFHYPGELYSETNTGEKLRPIKLLNAFRNLNYDVFEVTGTYATRCKLIDNLKHSINEFKFLYSENSNMPLSLCNQRRFPHLFSMDFKLFKLCQKLQIPSGVFIRDIFWSVKETANQKNFIKRIIGKYLFEHEVKFYYQHCQKIFLPSLTMKNYLPKSNFNDFFILPPGSEVIKSDVSKDEKGNLRFIYVGSCTPPVYQVLEGFHKILEVPNSSLTIVTRKNEHEYLKKHLIGYDDKLKITSAYGNELSNLLLQHDIALACVNSNVYWDLAMPIKIFEYLGHNLPIITYINGETGLLVASNNLGWAIPPTDSFVNIVSKITKKDINQKLSQVINFAQNNTWLERAKFISKSLSQD